VKTLKIYRVSP